MEGDWSPEAGEHEETVYYIAGYVLRSVHNRAEDKREPLRESFALLERQASVEKEEAKAAVLPIGRVMRAEFLSLYYASKPFYQFVMTVEAVFHHLMTEENVYLFGVLMLDSVVHFLGKIDLGLGQFLPGVDDADVVMVQQAIIDSYGNLRGKDFARKHNLRHGVSQTETTRATLGTIDYLNELKRKKRLKEEKEKGKLVKAGGKEYQRTMCHPAMV